MVLPLYLATITARVPTLHQSFAFYVSCYQPSIFATGDLLGYYRENYLAKKKKKKKKYLSKFPTKWVLEL